MPGLFGIYDRELEAGPLSALSARMQAALTHEPWYQPHTSVAPPFAGGRVSLGITNLGPQPAGNEDQSVLVFVDGEIYDFQRRAWLAQLRQAGHRLDGESDADILAHLYEDFGDECVRDLDGNFAVAIFDRRQDKLLIAVDRDANRPLYFYTNSGRFLFASEVKAIIQDQRVPRKVDEQGLIELFTFRHVMADRTLLCDVRYLPAGCLATFANGECHVRAYWEPVVAQDQPERPREAYVSELAEMMRVAVERQTQGDHTFGAYVSGGLDSRLAAGVIPDRLKPRFHSFTFGPAGSWDVKYGNAVAARLGGQHHPLDLRPEFLPQTAQQGVWYTDGLMTVIDIYMLNGIRRVKPFADVVFYGMGRVDGIVGGIQLNDELMRAKTFSEAAHHFYDHQGVYINDALRAKVLSPALHRATAGAPFEALLQELKQCRGDSFAAQAEAFCLKSRWPRSSGNGPVLTRTQIETRFPYSDNEFSDLACRVPARWRIHRRLQIELIKRTRPDLARIPYDYTGVAAGLSGPVVTFLSRGIFYVQRRLSQVTGGLVPLGTERERANWPLWFRTSLRPWIEGILLDKRTLERGYYNPAGLRHMLAEHMAGRTNYAVEFGLLLTFELWSRLVLDGEPIEA
ncbi:MAG: asparagine synthetase B family protein [Anaerolineales bacterium]